MKYMQVSIYSFCILFTIGCYQNISHQSKTTVTEQDLRGSWSYAENETDHAFVLRGFWNNEGKFMFKFVKQFYDGEPVFAKYSIRKGQIKIVFNLISYDHVHSKGKLKFILKKTDKNILQGQLFQPEGKSEMVTLKKYGNYVDTEPFEGIWSHSSIFAGKERIHVLRSFKDDTGRLRFNFLKQYYSYEPIFTEYSVHGNQIEIKFKLTAYATGYNSNPSIKYVLKSEEGFLVGQLYESWKEPVDVTLKSLNRKPGIVTDEN